MRYSRNPGVYEEHPNSEGRASCMEKNSVIRHGIAIANELKMARPEDKEVIPPGSRAAAGAADYSSGILELSNFDRLVYVICVLEHYTNLHCALLMHSSRSAVRQARARALAHIAEFESRWRELSADFVFGVNGDAGGLDRSLDSACGSLLD